MDPLYAQLCTHRYRREDTLVIFNASENHLRHLPNNVRSGALDLLLEPELACMADSADRDQRRQMKGSIVKAYSVEVMQELAE